MPTDAQRCHIAIIGSGFAGLCAAIKLKQAGENDFIIFERGASVGGTWRDNTYPGCQCDIPSILYSFSFDQNPDWSRKFPTQPEIWEYLKRVADKYGLLPQIRFNSPVTETRYDEPANVWRLRAGADSVTADIVISGAGGLSEPAFPPIQGMESFKGTTFHSAQWNHEYGFSRKRVAVIGTGASAIQVVPAIADKLAHLDVYQRTPPWVVPQKDRAIRGWEKKLRRTPLRWLFRGALYWLNELAAVSFVLWLPVMRVLQRLALHHIHRQVPDTRLRRRVTPNYSLGCKRILLSDTWYPTLQRENVSVVSDCIREVRDHEIITEDGTPHPTDAIIYCTGFRATDNPNNATIIGRHGQSLADIWRDGEEAYLGTLVHGFPNLFIVVGPNTGIGHTSLVFMIEAQVHYIMKCLKLKRDEAVSRMEVREEVQAEFNRQLHERMQRTVWATGCKSWYQNKSGKITTLWPSFTIAFWWRLHHIHRDDFTHAAPAPQHQLLAESAGEH